MLTTLAVVAVCYAALEKLLFKEYRETIRQLDAAKENIFQRCREIQMPHIWK